METRLLKATALFFEALLFFGIANRSFAQPKLTRTGTAIAGPQAHWRADWVPFASRSMAVQDTQQGQAISQTGVLPLFAVDMDIDASWVDGNTFPSSSPQFSHSGVNDALDQAWTTLKAAGFNMIRFPVQLDDPKSPVRVANLCLWAKANNITLIPVLQGTKTMRNDNSAMSAALGKLVTNVISSLRAGDGSTLTSYAQIGFYQLERPMNHAGLYPKMSAASVQKLLLTASAALRRSETEALQGTGVQATPISIAASFDFELIQQGAISGIPLDPDVEQRAQDSLKQYLMGFASPNIDAINLEWFPRSMSSGDVDHFVTLLRALKQSFPDKQLTLTTGFSTAFNTPDQALQYYAMAISNLGSFRASDGVDSKFVGVVFQQAFKGIDADTSMPAGTTDPSQWKWGDRAQQLSAMWSRGKASADMAWWVKKVEGNMGFVALQPNADGATSVIPLPGLQALQDISSSMTQASQQVQPPASVETATASVAPATPADATTGSASVTPTTSGYVAGAQAAGQVAVSPFQQLLFSLLQQFTQQIAVKLTMKIGGSSSVASSGRSSLANTIWIGPSDISVSTTSPATGESVVVTAQVHNQSSDQDVSGLTVQLVNPTNPAVAGQSIQGGVTVSRSSVTPVQLSWVPDATSAGQVQFLLQALDSSSQIVTSVAIPKITVQGANVVNTAATGDAGGSASSTTISPAANAGSTTVSVPDPSSNLATPIGSTSTTPSPTAQLTVTGFGLADPSSSAAGQIPQLTAQVSNPSQLPTQSSQAQLFLDGTPQQMQTMAPLLPSGILLLQFPAIQAAAGQHNLQLVITTADGVSASATFMANVTAPPATTSTGNSLPPDSRRSNFQPPRAISVRTAAPTTFRIGLIQTTTSSTRGVLLTGNPGGKVATLPSATKALSQPPALPANNETRIRTLTGQQGTVKTITPASVQATTATATKIPAPFPTPAVKTLTAGTVSTSAANSKIPSAQSSLPQSTSLSPREPASSGTVRTIPGVTTAAISQPAATNPALPASAGGTRTILPPSTGTTPQTPGSPGAGTQSAPAFPRAPQTAVPNNPLVPRGATTLAEIHGPMAPVGILDLAISLQDVHLSPVSPRAGQTATFMAAIRNAGTLPAQGASVVFVLIGNGQQLASSQPVMFSVPPRGVYQARWSTTVPPVAGLQIMVTVNAPGDSNPANNRVVFPFAVAMAPAQVPLKKPR